MTNNSYNFIVSPDLFPPIRAPARCLPRRWKVSRSSFPCQYVQPWTKQEKEAPDYLPCVLCTAALTHLYIIRTEVRRRFSVTMAIPPRVERWRSRLLCRHTTRSGVSGVESAVQVRLMSLPSCTNTSRSPWIFACNHMVRGKELFVPGTQD